MKTSLENLPVGNLANIQFFLSYLPFRIPMVANWYRWCSDVVSYEMYAMNYVVSLGIFCIRDARLRGNKITDNLRETPCV